VYDNARIQIREKSISGNERARFVTFIFVVTLKHEIVAVAREQLPHKKGFNQLTIDDSRRTKLVPIINLALLEKARRQHFHQITLVFSLLSVLLIVQSFII